MSNATNNYPPTRSPMVNPGNNTVAREWLRYFLDLTAGQNAGGSVPKPTPETALDFIRINAAGTAYEVQTPAQSLADMGGLTLAEAEALFEPLLDSIQVKDSSYQVVAGDTGLAILINAANGIATLPGVMNPGVKCFIAAGAPGVVVQADGNAFLNGLQGGSVQVAQGQGAYCEVVKNDTAANAYWSVSYDSGMTFTNGTLTLTGTEWQVGPGLQIEQPAIPAFVQKSTGSGAPTVVSLNLNPTIGNFLAFVALTGTTPPPASFEDFPLITSGIADGYYSGIYGDFAKSTISPTLVAGGAVESFRCLYEYTNVASVLGQDPTIGVSGTITPLSGSFSLSETLPCVGLSMVLTSTTGTDGNEHYSTPPNAVIRDYFTTLPFVNQGFSTVELPFLKGAGQVNFNYTGSDGIILVYVNAPTLLMISGGLINYPEIYALPTTIENQGSIIGVARTFNAGAGLGYTTDGNTATVNNQGVLSIGGNTGAVALGTGLTISSGTLSSSGGIIAQPQGSSTAQSFHTLTSDGSILFSGTGTDTLSIAEGQIILQSSTFVQNATIPGNQNGYTLGTPTIASGATVVIEPGATWFINQSFATGSAASGTIGVEVGGTLFPTLHAGPNITFGGTSPDLTINSSGGSIGVEYAGTLYPTLAAGANTTLTPSGSTLTVSASGGGSTASSGGLFSGVLASQPTNPPTTASMAFNTWTNQGGATFANGLQGVLLYNSTVGGSWNFKSKPSPSVPFTATVGVIFANPSYYNEVGFGFIDAAGKLQIIAAQVVNSPTGAVQIFLQEWTNYTTFSSNVVNAGNTGVFTAGLVFLRVNVTATTVTFSYSGDGEVFFTLFSAAISGGYLANYSTLFLGINVSAVPGVSASFVYYND